ncbi:MAG: bifunctional DNA primase/polymerase [Candidatus Nealsonbacteria bacterium]|nr:bifunctional DNA primase/polymerase [Candidatus Nealsonbacteria bacterium]
MKYVLCYPDSKQPIGKNWGKRGLSEDEMKAALAQNPHLNCGILLGLISGVIDVECDSLDATEAYERELAGVLTPCWQSTRGKHYQFLYDDRLADLPAVVKLPNGLEFRLGNDKAAQSICPPSTVDGVKREWILSPEQCPPAPLPESIINELLTLPPVSKKRAAIAAPETRNATVNRLIRYCDHVGLAYYEVTDPDAEGRVFIRLCDCPFKGNPHEDGAPVLIVFPDGVWRFYCLHAKCQSMSGKTAAIEEAFGPVFPVIDAKLNEATVAQTIQALSVEPNTYNRGGTLVEICSDATTPKLCLNDNAAPRARPIPHPTLRKRIATCARFEKWDGRAKKPVPCPPPQDLVSAVYENHDYAGVPVLTGIVSTPVLRADGSIANKPGYDAKTGLYLDVDDDYPVLMDPTDAVKLLLDIVCDFPFASEAHRSGWVAALVTLVSRAAFAGSAPLFLFDANRSGVGKGLLTDLLTMIFEGRKANRYDFPGGTDELRKLITTVALSAMPYCLFDNIKDRFGGAAIENAMTTGRWADRILGANRAVDIPLQLVWLGTSNNASLTGDMVRRTCHIRLNTDHENPSERTGFQHPNLLAHVKTHRRALAMAALSIPAQYIAAGRPAQNLTEWGSFENWSGLVRNSIAWVGLPDPGDTREMLAEQADDDTSQLQQLIDGWEELKTPATVGEAMTRAHAGQAPTLLEILDSLSGNPNHALGNLLRNSRGRVVGGRKLERSNTTRPMWRVIAVQGA